MTRNVLSAFCLSGAIILSSKNNLPAVCGYSLQSTSLSKHYQGNAPQPSIRVETRQSSFVPMLKRHRSRAISQPHVTSSRSAATTLSMHMGHSHAHHHDHSHSTQQAKPLPKGWKGKLVLLSSRRAVRILFAGLITLLPPILKHRSLRLVSRADVGAFVALSSVLAISDHIRDEAKAVIEKGESWRISMLKHSTPLSADYFFRNDNAADRVTFLGVIINVLLSAGKAAVGVTCHSSALIADAGHSLSDLFSDFVTLWAVQVARLPPDDDHPYGHGKFESVGSLFLSLTLLATGLSVGVSSYVKFVRTVSLQRSAGIAAAAKLVEVPTWPALVVAGISIASKEWLFRITKRVGEKLNSQVVIANAWHHRSDAYSSVLALISIFLAMAFPGFLAADPAAGMLVAGMICMTGAEILGESVKQLTDAVTDEQILKNVQTVSSRDADVKEVTRVRARQVGSSALVDVAVTTGPDLSASAMRAVEERIRAKIISDVDGVLDVDVKATGEDVVFCPLMTAEEVAEMEHKISATEVEEGGRKVLENHPDVKSVEGVTAHFLDTVTVRVDANIRVDPNTTVLQANSLAKELRKLLEESNEDIEQANIFLDLNMERPTENRNKVLSQ
mmetsp:Transcript_20671/g.41970  ORF Transcript_20671/g.41970 Transcript_20671/m.41970 type:complete len:617 (-) Transcript_20671:286-2136(-)